MAQANRETWISARITLTSETVAVGQVGVYYSYASATTKEETIWKARSLIWPGVEGRGSTPEIAVTNLIVEGCKLSSNTGARIAVDVLIKEARSWLR